MEILISFCNTKNNPDYKNKFKSALGLLNTTSHILKWIKIPEITGFNGITGITQNINYIYCVYFATTPGIFVFDKKNLSLINHKDLPFVKDPHSIVFFKKNLYIVSSGNDVVYKVSTSGKQIDLDNPNIFWKVQNNHEFTDTHHLNSITTYFNNLIISGFGPKPNNKWSSAKKGYIFNISKNQYLKKSIYHPHSLFVYKKNIYYCESVTKSVNMLEKCLLTLPQGYTRGLIIKKNLIIVATSSGRKVSKSTKLINNPADQGDLVPCCNVSIIGKKTTIYYFDKYYYEIYDIVEIINLSKKLPNNNFVFSEISHHNILEKYP